MRRGAELNGRRGGVRRPFGLRGVAAGGEFGMPVTTESDSVKSYLTILQGIVGRMAGNSAGCKTWCVTLVTALFALAIDKGKPSAILVGLLPLFLFLDAYYLSQEKGFREIYNAFVAKLKTPGANADADLYELSLVNNGFGQRVGATLRQLRSFSIWPFYGIILITLLVAAYASTKTAPAAATHPADAGKPSPTATAAAR